VFLLFFNSEEFEDLLAKEVYFAHFLIKMIDPLIPEMKRLYRDAFRKRKN
jgi:hypothetical protein